MLLHKVYALVPLATRAFAVPQEAPTTQNATVTTHPSPARSSQARVHQESTADGWEETQVGIRTAIVRCGKPGGFCSAIVRIENSATFWEKSAVATASSPLQSQGPQDTRVELIPSSTPTLVNIHTEIQKTSWQGVGGAGENTPTPAEDSPAIRFPQATPTDDSLVLEIISRIGVPVSSTNKEPIQSDNNAGGNVQTQQTPGANAALAITPVQSVPVITAGGQITLGSAILTLTPGLSSVLGDGASATLIAISTDEAGETLITVSSSGTAVTATVTNVPTTITRSRSGTGFDASITTTAVPGSVDNTSNNAAATTSSKGAAPSQGPSLSKWFYLNMGLTGLGLFAG